MSIENKNDLKMIATAAPKQPGVYFWYGKNKEVLYVGRAVNLQNRLKQYFQKNIDTRIAEMVGQAFDIKYTVCNSLLEAIILEAKNIKKYWPKYNIVDRDDRSFIYIAINQKAEFPKPIIIRGQDIKKFPSQSYQLFGPYQSYHLINSALRLIRQVFPYSLCQAHQDKACFDYQIGLCPGICINAITVQAYKKNIKNIILLLNGDHKRLLSKLEKENPEQAKSLQHLQDVSLLNIEEDLRQPRLKRIEGYDISHLQGKETYASMVVFNNGEKQSVDYRLFKIKEAPAGDDERALLEALLRRFKHEDWPRPEMIMIDGGSPQISFLNRELSKHNLILPLVGISKFGGDKLVFPKGVKQNFKDLATILKPVLLKVREEAHRFANYGRKRGSKKLGKINKKSLDN
ncbi:MAG: GIY-YIG nuclease family protein [Patescibacteria group bacterium]|nr:GIY-YIG nuclease family protein [Patescibacteria group bacterium]